MTFRLALALTVAATPALADLTAEEVLADQLNLLSGYGLMEIKTEGQSDTASGLSVARFVATHTSDTETVTLTIGGVELIEQPDGSVRVVYPASLPVTLQVEQGDGDVVTTKTTIELTDPIHTVSGDTSTMRHDFSATAVAINEILVDPIEELEAVDFSFAFALAGLSGSILMDRGAVVKRDLALDFDQMKLVTFFRVPEEAATPGSDRQPGTFDADMTFNDVSTRFSTEDGEVPHLSLSTTIAGIDWSQVIDVPEDDALVNLSQSAADLAMEGAIQMSVEDMEEDYVAALRSGQHIGGKFSAGALSYDFDIETPDGPIKALVSSQSSLAELALNDEGLRYSGAGADMSVMLMGQIPEFPLPGFGYAVDAAEFALAFPLLPSDAAQSFELKYLIDGLSVAEELWALFDPAGQIPRDPLDLEIDLEGTTVIAEDLTTTDADMPFTNTEARLNALNISVAGVSFQANGQGRDLSDGGMPKGDGTLNFTLSGANTLLDTLVGMGLLPEEQAMGARMGLALFTRPDGEDVLTSTIEITEDGSVLANGQRIK